MKQIAISIIALAVCLATDSQLLAQGVWTQLTNPNPSGSCGVPMLLSDGSVIVCAANGFNGVGASSTWTKLTPDSAGNYINGFFEDFNGWL